MAKLQLTLALLTSCALAGCGSHNRAPVVYGTAPTAQHTARIYTSPEQIAAERRAAQSAQYARAPYASAPEYSGGISPAVSSNGLAPLTPVTETRREGRDSPVYLAAAGEPPAPAMDEALPGQVTVLPGDTVYAISRRTGATPQSIIALNRLAPPYTLSVGQTIRVPSSAVPPSRLTASAGAAPAQSELRDGQHIVRPGDTLYSISRATGAAVGDIARANRLRAPYTLSVGETLRIPSARVAGVAPERAHAAETNSDVGDFARSVSYGGEPAKKPSLFDWPVQGAIIGNYGLSTTGKRNDGVNIAAPVGTPVRAAADGEVVYRGSELKDYGNLLLIKHEDGFVTAYAHNDAMLVKKGDRVRRGQVIAKVGQSGSAGEPQLHFEIRQNLKAVDPVALLGSL
ncbi:MAG: M23 family metallopeptidase [Parvularculaceae bacterium]|nr:M23 family metallopeptidase [Parvularculaceae bacterium]